MKGKLRYLVISFLLVAAAFTFGNNYVFADETTGAVEVTATEELNKPAVKLYIFRGEVGSHCA
jgi:hypothetical protein